jgi:hypothetical protein
MSNELMKPSALLSGLQTMMARPVVADNDGKIFMKFTKGEWLVGREEAEPDAKSLWALNPFSATRGYICWGEGAPIDERMASLTAPPVDPSTLPSHTDSDRGWEVQMGVELVCVEGDMAGTTVAFGSSSRGGLQAIQKLLTSLMKQAESGGDDIVPVMTLGSDSYKHPKFGRVYTPEMEIKEWCTLEDTLETYSGGGDTPDDGGDEPPAEPTEAEVKKAAAEERAVKRKAKKEAEALKERLALETTPPEDNDAPEDAPPPQGTRRRFGQG